MCQTVLDDFSVQQLSIQLVKYLVRITQDMKKYLKKRNTTNVQHFKQELVIFIELYSKRLFLDF